MTMMIMMMVMVMRKSSLGANLAIQVTYHTSRNNHDDGNGNVDNDDE